MELKSLWVRSLVFITLLCSISFGDEDFQSASSIKLDDFVQSVGDDQVIAYIEPTSKMVFKTAADPFEPLNRVTFYFNTKVIKYFIYPTGRVYETIIPRPIRKGLSNAIENLSTPVSIVNNLIQGKGKSAGRETLRFITNSTLGIAGLFDIASKFNIEQDKEDTGQTLEKYGMKEGFVIVLPFLPHTNARDLLGFVVDLLIDPNAMLSAKMFEGSAARAYPKVFYTYNETVFQLDTLLQNNGAVVDSYKNTLEALTLLRKKDLLDTQKIITSKEQHPLLPTMQFLKLHPNDQGFFKKFKTQEVEVPNGKKATFSYISEGKNRPMVVLFVGVASGRLAFLSMYFAEKLYNMGYDLLTVSSSFNHEFLNYSKAKIPGYSKIDSADMYDAIHSSLQYLKDKKEIEPSSISVLGYSMGANEALNFANQASEHGNEIAIEKTVVLNPIPDLIYTMNIMDNYFVIPDQIKDAKEKKKFIDETLAIATYYATNGLNFGNQVPLTEDQQNFLIGYAYRKGLRNFLQAVETKKGYKFGTDLENITWKMYLNDYLVNYYKNEYPDRQTSEVMNQYGGLHNLDSFLNNNKSIAIMHAKDDTLISNEDLSWVQSLRGPSIKMFNQGGHLGYVDSQEFQEYFKSLFSK